MNTQAHTIEVDAEATTSGLPVAIEAQGSLAVSLARAEVDQQIATARALPRSISRAVANITTLATLDELSAEECVYALPRGGKPIKGPSIRLAEIIASQWGNCRVGARVVHVDRFEKYIEAEGVFHDLETNTATTSRVRRRISDRNGRLLNDDMIVVTGNAAASIAKRNAILGGVPKAVWRKAYDSVERTIAGDVKTISERRDRAMKAFAAFGVKPEQIFESLDVGGPDDIGLDHIVTLTGMHAALKSGEATIEELFPVPDAKTKASGNSSLEKKAAEIKAKREAVKEEIPHDKVTGEIKQVEDSPRNEAPTVDVNAAGEGVMGTRPPKADAPPEYPLLLVELDETFAVCNSLDDLNGKANEAAEAWYNAAPEAVRNDGTAIYTRHKERIEQASKPKGFGAGSTQRLDPIAVADTRGVEARTANLTRKNMPDEYKEAGREAEAKAWNDGFTRGTVKK